MMELSTEEQKLLDDPQNEFKNRFTGEDTEFMEVVQKKLSDPPIVQHWVGKMTNYYQNDRRRGQDRYNKYLTIKYDFIKLI